MPKTKVTRRDFFAHLGVSAVDAAANSLSAARGLLGQRAAEDAKPPALPWLRPPGALSEAEFQRKCTRCDACIQACPHASIRRLGPEFGKDAGTPAVIPAESPCYLCDGMPCIPVCEPGALLPTPPSEVTMGLALIELAECYAMQGQPCDYCILRCPLKTQAIRPGKRGAPVIIQGGCVGCGVCAHLCPPGAIRIGPPATTATVIHKNRTATVMERS